MISMEAWTTIRYLRSLGHSIRSIAKELNISRNTVKKALKSEHPPSCKRGPRINPDLDPFCEVIREMLIRKKFIGTRILREIHKSGYDGSNAAFYRYLSKIKVDLPNSKVSERYETGPGIQGQFDWSPYTIELGGELTQVTVFCLTLSFSRRKHYFPSLNETQGSIFEALEECFWYFGGVPKEVLVDNARALVLDPRPGYFRWNPRFLEFCGHYRYRPVACKIGRARTKGKVENPFFYLEQHFIKGNTFRDLSSLTRELLCFEQEELDQRIHGTTQERPIDRFDKEKAYLTSLPESRYVGTRELFRKVSWDCLVSFDGTRYSVPYPYAGKQVWIRTSQGSTLNVYSQKGELIAIHSLSPKKGLTILNEDHYKGLRKSTPRGKALLEELFLEAFPEEKTFLEKLLAQQKLNPAHHLRGIMQLCSFYPKESLSRAFGLSLEYNTFSLSFIRGILEKETPFKDREIQGPKTLREFPKISVSRPLHSYQQLVGIGERRPKDG